MDKSACWGRTSGLALVLALAIFAGGVRSETDGAGKQLVEQKIRLLEMLVASPSAKADSGGLGERGSRALALAREAVAEGRYGEAAGLVDDVLRSSAAATRKPTVDASLSDSALRLAHQNLIEQVATYRASIEDLLGDPKHGGAARALLIRIDTHSGQARGEAGAGRLAEANRILGDAYKLAVGELSRLRAGQEVVMSLNFASPAEEYAYEINRFESSEMMVGMMIGEGKVEGDRKALVEDFRGEARRLRGEAEAEAKSGRHKEAVAKMEKAGAQLNRALQTMGVPVF